MAQYTRNVLRIGVLLLLLLTVAGRLTFAQDTQPCGTDSGEGCAPESERVDLYKPTFSDPTNITHPLFPASTVTKTLLLGHVDGQPLHVEYTLLPEPRIIEWNGQQIATVEVQYVAHVNGFIVEVALDWYAQDDNGAVWYFGEDVTNYEEGVIANREGTWMAGTNGPVAMIMPADPQVGDVYRVENIPNIVFEEVTVAEIGLTVNGPASPVAGAIVVRELHMDGEISNKTFASGYGEFVTTNREELEAVALAIPTDALAESIPAELEAVSSGAATIFDAAEVEDWDTIATTLATMTAAWETYQAGDVPLLLDAQMSAALIELLAAVDVRQSLDVRRAANEVALAALDLQLSYQPLTDNEMARFDLWTRQVLVDSAADDAAAVLSDVTTLEWIAARFAHTLDSVALSSIESQLGELRAAADEEDLEAVSEVATGLLGM